MADEGVSKDANSKAEGRVSRALAQVVYAGAETRQQADAIMAGCGLRLNPKAAARNWVVGQRGKSDLAKLVVEKLVVCMGTLERHMAQAGRAADGIAARLATETLPDKDAMALVQRYTELMKCLCELAKQTAERKRSVVEAGEGDDKTLAAILGYDLQFGGPCGNTVHDATRQAAAATATLFEAVGEAR